MDVVTTINSITAVKINDQLAAIARHCDELDKMVRIFISVHTVHQDTLGAPLWDAIEATSYTLPRLSTRAKAQVNAGRRQF